MESMNEMCLCIFDIRIGEKMTLYGEEEIVKLLNIHKKYSIGNVYTGIAIKGDTYHFHEYSFWEHQVKLMLPLRFIDMPKQVWDAKYGHLEKMDIVKCSRDYSIDMMLSLTEEKLEEGAFFTDLISPFENRTAYAAEIAVETADEEDAGIRQYTYDFVVTKDMDKADAEAYRESLIEEWKVDVSEAAQMECAAVSEYAGTTDGYLYEV